MTYRLRITAPGWSGKVDGKDVRAKQGDILDVDLITFTALLQRELAEPVPIEEIVEMEKKEKLDKPVALDIDMDRIKRLKRPIKDKMVRAPTKTKMGPIPRGEV